MSLYTPFPVPHDAEELSTYLRDELQRLSAVVNILAEGHLDVSYVVPDRPRAGDLRVADGTSWDPGSGAGLYLYQGGSWNKL